MGDSDFCYHVRQLLVLELCKREPTRLDRVDFRTLYCRPSGRLFWLIRRLSSFPLQLWCFTMTIHSVAAEVQRFQKFHYEGRSL